MINRNNLPEVNEIGRKLEIEGLVEHEGRLYQTEDNCLEVANMLAEQFGYIPFDRRRLTDLIFDKREVRLWGNSPFPERKSPVCFIIRTPDIFGKVHVALEAYGREYNYGPGTEQRFPIETRIPLNAHSL